MISTSALGLVELNIFGIPAKFYVVPNEFPIPCDGILGTNFFIISNSIIDFRHQRLVSNGRSIPLRYNPLLASASVSRSNKAIVITSSELITNCWKPIDGQTDLELNTSPAAVINFDDRHSDTNSISSTIANPAVEGLSTFLVEAEIHQDDHSPEDPKPFLSNQNLISLTEQFTQEWSTKSDPIKEIFHLSQ